jgi:iron complex outermembrane recepter protein
MRYITNKPKLDVDEGSADASYSTTAHGNPNASGVAMINVAIIPGTFALRAVIYDDSRGGYIHNVPATFTRSPSDAGIAYYFGGVVPPGSTSLSNSSVVSRAFNPLTYEGVRVSGLYQFNEDWNFLLQQSYQSIEADGVFAYDPQLGDLDVQQYNPSQDLDKFEDTAWTLNGRIGALQLVYTGGYLVRNVDQTADYGAMTRKGIL